MDPYPVSSEANQPQQGKGPAPAPVKMAVKLIWASIALSVISTIATFALLDDMVDAAVKGTSGADKDAARIGVITGAVVGLVIGVGLAVLFAYFIGKGANWARIVYTVITVLGVLLGAIGLLGSQPLIVLLLTVVGLVLSVAIVFFLFRPESNAYFKKVHFAG